MTTETYDNKPKFNPNKPFTPVGGKPAFDPNKPFDPVGESPVKKKESAQEIFRLGLETAGTFLGLLPSKEDGKSTEIHNAITQKPFKKQNPFAAPVDEKTDTEARTHINEIMYGEDDKWKDPIKAIDTKLKKASTAKEFSALSRAGDLAVQSIAPNGFTAKQILNDSQEWKALGNQTGKVLKSKADKYDIAVAPLREIEGLEGGVENMSLPVKNALIKKYTNENPDFAKELAALGLDVNDTVLAAKLPNGKVGQIIAQQLDDPDIHTYVTKESEKLLPALQHVKENLLTDQVDFGINQVANKVSRAVQKSGYNNIDPVFNFYGEGHKEYADQVAKQVLNPQEQAIWDSRIRDNQEQYMDAPSLFQGIGEAGGDFGKGILNTLTQPFKPISRTLRENMEKEASHVSANPEGVSKFLRDTGHAVGLVASITATAGGGGGEAGATALGFFGDMLEQGKVKYPDKPVTAFTSAAINTAFYVALSKQLFPGAKAKQVFEKVRPEVDSIIENLTSGKIAQEAARNQLKTVGIKAADFIAGSLGKNAKVAAELTLGKVIDQTFDKINMDAETFEKVHPEGELGETGAHAFLSNLVISGLAKAGEMKRGNHMAEEAIWEAATQPKMTERLIEESKTKDPSINADELKNNLQYLTKVKSELDEAGIEPNNQKRYLFESIKDKVLQEKAEASTDPTISKQAKEQAKASNEIKEGILNGKNPEEIITTAEADEIKQTLKIETDRNKLIEKGHSAIDKLLEEKDDKDQNVFKGIYRDIAKSDPLGFLEEVANQAQGVSKTGKPLAGGAREIEMIPKYGADVINVAKELFPANKESNISVVMPGEIKQPETTTIAPKELVPEPRSKGAAIILPKPKESETQSKRTEEVAANDEPGKANGESGEPPKITEATQAAGEGEEMRLSHSDTEKIYKDLNLPERLETPTKKNADLLVEADEMIAKGYDANSKAEKIMKGEDVSFEDKDQVAFAKIVAGLKEKQNGVDIKSEEFDKLQDQIEKLSRAADVAGTSGGRFLQSRKAFVPVEESLSDYVMREKEAAKVEVLTEAQKETIQKEFQDIDAATKAYEEKIQSLKDENARLRAEAEVKKAQPKTKGEKKDYKKERAEIFTSIQEKLKKARGDTSVTVVPYAKELFAIAPDVAKLVKSYAEQGVVELSEMIKKVHSDLKDAIPEVTDNDVRDLIAGNYNEKKQTRNKLSEILRDLRDEAKLVNQLEGLENGEVPINEKKKIERNRKITELREKIKNHDLTKLTEAKKRIQSQIKKVEEQIKRGDFGKTEEKAKIKLDKEAQQLQDNLIKVKNERQLRLLKEEYRASSTWNKIQTETANVLGVPRTLMASVDYSAPLRQALLATISHPQMASKAAAQMFKSSFSKKNYDRWFFELENSDRFSLMKESGLGISDINNPKLSAKEEQYMNGLAEKLPVIGKLIKGSERAYTMYLNKMRVDLFSRFVDQMQKDGKTFENSKTAYKQTAAYVNNMTGRGDLGKTMNEAAPVLNQLFFSPRLMASRINTLTYLAQPRFYSKVPKEVRMDYFRSLVATAGIGLTILALARMGGADTEDDPRSPDFGKIKSGNTRWDIWGGHQQYIRLAAQMISGKKKSSTTGKISEIGTENPYSGTRGGLGLDFLRGKLAPVPSIGVDILAGENTIGQKLTTDWKGGPKEIGLGENLANHLLPLTFTGLYDAMKDQGAKAWFTVGIPSIFGTGTQTYSQKKLENTKKAKPSKPNKKTKK